MKISLWAGLLLILTSSKLFAQSSAPLVNTIGSSVDKKASYSLIQRDANSRTWERTNYERTVSGQIVARVQHYTEIASGMYYQKDGALVESKEEIEMLPQGGAAATKGQHQAYFPGEIYQGQIELVTPDGEHLKSRPLGLGYDDGHNTVLIAELTNSVGVLVGNNQVIYPNAFSGLKADLRYTYSRSGFEQDVILREQPPSPDSLGLDAKSTRLEILTEFFESPNPTIQVKPMPKQAGLSMADEDLGFGQMQMMPGRAFLTGENNRDATVRVGKAWLLLDGRRFLVEQVPASAVLDAVRALPAASSTKSSQIVAMSPNWALPSRRLAKASSEVIRVSQASSLDLGFVLDYQAVNSTYTNYTFQGDTTYYISGLVNLYGTTKFEGGTVIKFTNSPFSGISAFAAPIFQTGPYRPAIFTSIDDNSVGETIPGSTGSPTNTGAIYLFVDSTAGGSGPDVVAYKYLRFAYANVALESYYTVNPCPVEHCQFIHCAEAMQIFNGTPSSGTTRFSLYNDLFSQCGRVLESICDLEGEHITADQVDVFYESSDDNWTRLTNCIFTAVEDPYNIDRITIDHCLLLGSGSGIYKAVGGGNYYLADNSTNRNAGTTGINLTLLAELAKKTTYAPTISSNLLISADTTLSPQAYRDIDSPDLGYHYDPLDYLVGNNTVSNATVTITPGTIIGSFAGSGQAVDAAIRVSVGGHVLCQADPKSPSYLVYYDTVQENTKTNWLNNLPIFSFDNSIDWTEPSASSFEFTKWSSLSGRYLIYAEVLGVLGAGPLNCNSCEFYNGKIFDDSYDAALTNCLFARVSMEANQDTVGVAFKMTMQNCLLWNGKFTVFHLWDNNYFTFRNNLFDHTQIIVDEEAGINDHNGYITNSDRLTPEGANDVILAASPSYQSGPLGDFYLPGGSSLINAGTTNANIFGLFHFTTQTNQVKETNSIVDIGYHYVALDGVGNLDDFDSDGIPDYMEDANGNGAVDGGESSWLLGIVTQPQNQNVPQGVDVIFSVTAGGLTPFSYQWKFNGTNISGATDYRYTNFVVTIDDEGSYSVTVTNATGSVTSSNAQLKVNVPLSINNSLQDQTVLEGQNGSFSISVTGNYPAYQWYADAVPLVNSSHIAGANSSTLIISNATLADQHRYTATVSNLFNTVGSSGANLIVIPKPGIVSAPTNVVAIQSDDVTLSDVISGGGLYFQWWLTNSLGTNSIPGAITNSYTKLVIRTNDAGHYSLVITDIAGRTNANTELTVLVPPWIVQQPVSVTTNQGGSATFTISAVGTTNLFYQWYKNGTNVISGATNSSFSITNIQAGDAAGYSALVTNVAGTNISAWAWLSVNLSGGGTTNGWGSGGSPPASAIWISMVGPTNGSATNPAVYKYGPSISIRASAHSQYNYITNVAFYFTGTNYGTNFMLAGTGLSGANTKFALEWTNAIPGTNILKARAWDNNGNTNDSDVVYVIMDQPPQIDLEPPTVSAVWEDGPVSVWFTNYISDDGLPYGITNYSWTLQSHTAVSNVDVYTGTTLMVATYATFSEWGNFQLLLRASDGFLTNSANRVVSILHRPTVSFNTPTNGATIPNGDPILLDVTATGVTATITNVSFYNGSNTIADGVQSISGRYRFYWTNAPPGPRILTAIAWDRNGLTATSTVSTVVVTPSFSVNFYAPTNNQFFVFSPTNILLNAFVSPGSSGTVTNVVFTNLTSSNFIGAGTLTNSLYQTLWGNVTNGTYALSVTARDDAGNVATNGIVVTVNAMPVVSVVFPTNVQLFLETTNVQLTALASDLEDGTNVSVVFYTNGTFFGTAAHTVGRSNVLVWSGLGANSRPTNYYSVVAVATDSKGASSASAIGVFKVATTNPVPAVQITYPTNGSIFAADSDLTISAATNGVAAVTNVEFFVNGESIGNDPDAPYDVKRCCWKPGSYVLVAKATGTASAMAISDPVEITIQPELPTSGGYWDTTFYNPYNESESEWDEYYSPIVSSGTNMYVYNYADTDSALALQQWDGTNWNGVWLPTNEIPQPCDQIIVDGTNVYLSASWLNVDVGFSPTVYELKGANWSLLSDLFANQRSQPNTNWIRLGDDLDPYFEQAFPSDYHFRFYGEDPPMSGAIDAAAKMVMIGSDLYIGGAFVSRSDTNIVYIAKLNRQNNTWERVGNGLNAPVYTLCDYNNQLVIGGAFTNAGGNPQANHIAILAGNVWTNLGTGISGGPTFSSEGSTPGFTNPPAGEVWSLATCGSNLFVGGNFTTAGSNTNANAIAVWNGTEWQSVGRGLYSISAGLDTGITNLLVTSVVPRGNSIYVGGQFGGAWGEGTNKVRAYNIAQATWNEDQQTWNWSDLDLGIMEYVDPAEGGTLDVPVATGIIFGMSIVNGPTPESYDLYVCGSFLEKGSRQILTEGPDIIAGGIARWRVGYPQPPTRPTVSILQPTSPYIFTNSASQTNIFLIGQATSVYTNITFNEAHFYTNHVEIGNPIYSYQESNKLFFTNKWENPSPGLYLINAVAKDEGGLSGQSTPIVINVKSGSNAVTAFDDQYVIPEGTKSITLPVLTNDMPSSGLRISRVTTLNNNLGQPRVGPSGNYLTYAPLPDVYGLDTFYYTVSDGTNLDSASVTVKILARPVVTISAPDDYQRFVVSSPPITVSAMARDYDGSVTNLMFYTNGVPYKVLTNSVNGAFATNWTANAAGFYTFVAVATDSDGLNTTSSPVTVVLTNLTPSTNLPVAAISNLVDSVGNNQGVVTNGLPVINVGMFDLVGQASDLDGDPVSYAVQLFRPEDWDFTASTNLSDLIPVTNPFADVTPGPKNAQGFHTNGAVGDLGKLDLTAVPDGVYDLVLRVRGGTDETNAIVRVQVQNNLKIGQFSFSEQDLVLPVNGIPLTVIRTYNSLNPESGSFGTSWSFALNEMNVKLDDERTDVTVGTDSTPFDEENADPVTGLPKVVSVRTGGNWDVTLTLPDGNRTTFTFGYYGAWPTLHATWTAPSGITAKLEAADSQDGEINFGYSGLSVPVWRGSDLTTGYAPFNNQDFPGWILTTADGTKYHITRGTADPVTCLDPNGSGNFISARVYGPPKLTEIEQLSGATIQINDNGIFNYDATNKLTPTRWTLFDRDDAGRITALRDPTAGSNGLPVVKYVYNHDTDNLIQVLKLVDRDAGTYTTNKYRYDNSKFPHYITSIENGSGVPVAQNFYDDAGRLTAVQDANGTLTQFNHSLTNNSEVVIDRLGHTNTYVYDLQGNVIWATNALGQVTATAYTDTYFPTLKTTETNAYGTAQAAWTLYQYDSAGNQTNVISMGHTNSFEYDGHGNLLAQVDPLGNLTKNVYDDAGNLTSTAQYDANNHLIQQSSSVYVNGKLTQTLNGNGQPTATFGYDEYGNLTNTVDANNFARGFTYDANGNQTGSSYTWTPPGGSPTNITTTTIYDAQNRVIQSVDAFRNTNYTFYNTLGKVDYTVDKFGGTNSFIYDALGNLIQTTYPNNTHTRTAYDGAGRAYLTLDRNGITGTRTDYDAVGRATNTVRLTNVVIDITFNGSVAASVVTSVGVPISTNSTVYDAAGHVKSRTSPDGTTTYDYYPDGQLMDVVDALNQTNFYAYDAAGRQTNMVDALNHSTKFQYDAVGRMIATIYDDNTTNINIFDNLGQRTGVLDQATSLTRFGYNISGQLTNVIKPSVPDPETGIASTNAQWAYLYDSYGHPTVTIDPKNRGTTNVFDAYNRQFSQRLPMNQTNLVQYNALGQVVTNFDFKGQRTEFRYDQYGHLTNKFYFVVGQTHPSNSVSYVYNKLDQVTNITERFGSDADASYAANNQLEPPSSDLAKALAFIGQTAPRWGGLLTPLLLVGGMLTLTARGRRLKNILAWYYIQGGWRLDNVESDHYHRTKRLRLPSFFWRSATIVILGVLVTDDPSWDNLLTARADCSIPSNESPDTTRVTNYIYDFDGRVAQVNSPEGVINYGYDLATGRLLSTCTTNSYITYTYDQLGRLKTVSASKRNRSDITPETTTYHYDKVGNRSGVDLPNGVVTTNLYDNLNRLTNMVHKFGLTTNAWYSYKLDVTGRRTNAVEVLLEEESGGYLTNTLRWQFDGMYRLTNEVNLCSSTDTGASYTNSYSYDIEGNRFKKITTAGNITTITNLYNANDELVREVTKSGTAYTETNNYAYDANGSMIGLTNSAVTGPGTNVYAYNLMNKLSSVTSGTTTTSFQYNDQGIRVRTIGASTKYYLIDANNHTGYQQVLEEFSTLGTTPTRSYVIGDDVLAQADSGSASCLLYDGHGSTRQVVDNSGTVTSRYSYDAYGATQVTSTSSAQTGLLYCGEQYESALQMYNLRARYYTPGNGRFNQRDTFAGGNFDPQSLHKYLYCGNLDPINGLDPSGQMTMAEILVVAGIIGLLGGMTIGAIVAAKKGYSVRSSTFWQITLTAGAIGAVVGVGVGFVLVSMGIIAVAGAGAASSPTVQQLEQESEELVPAVDEAATIVTQQANTFTQGGLSNEEFQLAQRVGRIQNWPNFQGAANRVQAGYDGSVSGRLMQLKEVSSTNPANILSHLQRSYAAAQNAGFKGIEGHVWAENITKDQVEKFVAGAAQGQGLAGLVSRSSGTITKIFVYCKDGIVEIYKPAN